MVLNEDLRSRRIGEREEKKYTILTIILLILCFSLFFTKFVWLKAIEVSGSSMEITLHDGDQLLMDKLASPKRGDVVVFTRNNMAYIKRVVAVEGDTVRIKDGNLYVKKADEENFEIQEYNGVVVPTYPEVRPSLKPFKDLVINKGYVYCLGDNRTDSQDSRFLGQIGLNEIDGVVHQFIIDHKDGFLGKFYRWL